MCSIRSITAQQWNVQRGVIDWRSMQFPLGFRFFLRSRRHAAPAHATSYITRLTSWRVTTAKISALSTPGHGQGYAPCCRQLCRVVARNEDLVGGHATDDVRSLLLLNRLCWPSPPARHLYISPNYNRRCVSYISITLIIAYCKQCCSTLRRRYS